MVRPYTIPAIELSKFRLDIFWDYVIVVDCFRNQKNFLNFKGTIRRESLIQPYLNVSALSTFTDFANYDFKLHHNHI
jgi:hypothetical protein